MQVGQQRTLHHVEIVTWQNIMTSPRTPVTTKIRIWVLRIFWVAQLKYPQEHRLWTDAVAFIQSCLGRWIKHTVSGCIHKCFPLNHWSLAAWPLPVGTARKLRHRPHRYFCCSIRRKVGSKQRWRERKWSCWPCFLVLCSLSSVGWMMFSSPTLRVSWKS
mgnify:CR=1 FL=1